MTNTPSHRHIRRHHTPSSGSPRRWRRDDRGSVAAEATVVVPVLLLLLIVATVVAYRTVSTRLALTDAAHQAARAASLASSSTTAITAAQATAAQALDGGLCASTNVTVNVSDFQPGGLVTVSITCQVHLADAPDGVPDTATMTASSSSPVDQWRTATTALAPDLTRGGTATDVGGVYV